MKERARKKKAERIKVVEKEREPRDKDRTERWPPSHKSALVCIRTDCDVTMSNKEMSNPTPAVVSSCGHQAPKPPFRKHFIHRPGWGAAGCHCAGLHVFIPVSCEHNPNPNNDTVYPAPPSVLSGTNPFTGASLFKRPTTGFFFFLHC